MTTEGASARTLLPSGSQALRHAAADLDQQAATYDRLMRRSGREISTVAEAFRTAASLLRQKARRLEDLEKQVQQGTNGEVRQ